MADRILEIDHSLALYKLPFDDCYMRITSAREPLMFADYSLVGEHPGFVVAPFSTDGDDRIVLIRPDEISRCAIPTLDLENKKTAPVAAEPVADAYKADFNVFHSAVRNGQYGKLVLARTKETALQNSDYERLFLQACAMYPRQLVALTSTPATGTWLTCTPEVLLSLEGRQGFTMALAGTMPWKDCLPAWSEKNLAEQKVVEGYIEKCLKKHTTDVSKGETYSRRAGNLAHLCTDFAFRLAEDKALGELLAALHPTPAVCGMPQNEARDFIIKNEHIDRKYYSGFMGPVLIDGKTQLFVSLRCACLQQDHAILYSGGGIMPDSELLSEWEETENKMRKMTDVLE